MEIHIEREPTIVNGPGVRGVTLGSLFVNGNHQWWTLEDTIRPLKDKWLHPGETAIPSGRYRCDITWSVRFHRKLPLIQMVPGFSGVRIHPGNTAADTEGCILIGGGRAGLALSHSRYACDMLQAAMQNALDRDESIWLTIEDPIAPIAAAGTKVAIAAMGITGAAGIR